MEECTNLASSEMNVTASLHSLLFIGTASIGTPMEGLLADPS